MTASSESHAPPATVATQKDLRHQAEMLGRYLYVLGAPVDRVDDLTQEVFVFTLDRAPAERSPAELGRFLRGVAKNFMLRDRRSRAARREIELAHDVWCEEPECDERVESLRACIKKLPDRSRQILHRRYVDDAGRDVLGSEFGMRTDGIKTILRRIRETLRACVERRLRQRP